MPSTDAPTWWADVQQEREDLTGGRRRRPAEDWLGEDIDFVPRRRMRRGEHVDRPLRERAAAEGIRRGADHELHGVFVPATSRTIELEISSDARDADVETETAMTHELRHLAASDDPFATPPPPAGARRTVQIKGRPQTAALPSLARRHRPRTASDRVGHRPDRIALWAVVLGAVLILLAATSARSQAAVPHRAASAPAAHARVVHAVHRAPLRVQRVHR